MPPYRIIDHPSDVGLEIISESIEDLFADAIKGLFSLITGEKYNRRFSRKVKKSKRRIVIRYDRIENALIELLNRIIYFVYTKGILFYDPRVKIKKGKIILKSRVIKDGFQFMEREIKAATYHNLSIVGEGGKYETTIIFDV